MLKRVTTLIVTISFVIIMFQTTGYSAAEPKINTGTAILMDADTCQILYSKKENKKMYPASITKIMSAVISAENGFDPKKKARTSSKALSYMEPGAATIWAKEGEVFTEKQLLMASFLASANDATLILAEKIAGSIPEFCRLMNDKAKELGCKNTHFENPTGLFNKKQVTSAYDMALITREAINNRRVMKYFTAENFVIGKTNKTHEKRYLYTLHKMLGHSYYYYYKPTVAGKTGWTTESGNTLVTYCVKDDMRLICVMLDGEEGARIYDETTALMEYGFDNYKKCNIDISKYITSTNPVKKEIYADVDKSVTKKDMSVDVKENTDSVEVNVKLPEGKKYTEVIALATATPTPTIVATATPTATPTLLHKAKDIVRRHKLRALATVGVAAVLFIVFVILLIVLIKKKKKKNRDVEI